MRSRRCSVIFLGALIGGLVLLGLWVDSFAQLTRFETRPATSSLKVELCQGVLTINWMEAPDWYEAQWNTHPGLTREAPPDLSSIWAGRCWVPDLHSVNKGTKVAQLAPGPPGTPPVPFNHGTLDDHRLRFPLWQIFTLYVALCWIAFAIRQRRRRREWQRQQAAAAPQLLEPS